MSHTNTTTNYGLPQFLSSDKPAWMADINVAFADIDGQMKTNADAASAAQTTADNAVLNGAPGYSNLSTYAVGDVVNYLGRVYKCDIAVATPEAFDSAKWTYYRLSDASAQLDVIDSEIGNTDISGIGDGSITGAVDSVNDGLYKLTSDNNPDFTEVPSGRTFAQCLYALSTRIDTSKVTRLSKLVIGKIVYNICTQGSNLAYSRTDVTGSNKIRCIYAKIGSVNSLVEVEGSTLTDYSNTIASDDFKFYY